MSLKISYMHSFLFLAFAAIKPFILGMCPSLHCPHPFLPLTLPPFIILTLWGKIIFLLLDLLLPISFTTNSWRFTKHLLIQSHLIFPILCHTSQATIVVLLVSPLLLCVSPPRSAFLKTQPRCRKYFFYCTKKPGMFCQTLPTPVLWPVLPHGLAQVLWKRCVLQCLGSRW